MGRRSRNAVAAAGEKGTSGLIEFGGRISEEFHRRLQGSVGTKVYREMRDNDAIVGAIMFAVESLILQVPIKFTEANDSAEAKAAAQLMVEVWDDMYTPNEDVMTEIITMLTFGWAFFETVYKQRRGTDAAQPSKFDDGKWAWHKIALRSQDSLDRWDLGEYGDILGLWQAPWTSPSSKVAYIPMSKGMLFRTRSHKNNPEGRSMLRNAYRSWYFLKRIQEIEAVGVERDLAGLPVMEVPAEIMSPRPSPDQASIRAMCEDIVQKVRRDEREGLVLPSATDRQGNPTGYKFYLMSTGGKRALDVNKIVVRYEQRIAMTILAQFLMLGMDEVGSFALASTQTNLFSMALGAIVKRISSVFNTQGIPQLMKLNGVAPENWPKMSPGDFEAPSLKEFAEALNNLVGAQVLTPDDDLEDHVRAQMSLPPRGTPRVAPAVEGGETDPEDKDLPAIKPSRKPAPSHGDK